MSGEIQNETQHQDRICLHGMRFFGYHGVLPEEKSQGQKFELDVELFCSLDKPDQPGWRDDLKDTIDYREIYREIKQIVEQERFELIETLALCIANRILDNYPVRGVCVRVRKPEVPLPGPLSWAGVEICRWKQLSQENQAAVYVALGSNLGDREAYLWQALGLLSAEPAVKVRRVSSFYETKPVGNLEQPDFLNAVVQLACSLSPLELLRTLQAIEIRLGRERLVPWGPRTIDMDLLLFGQETVEEPGLTVPHPRLLERDFVLVPLAEIAPDLILPDGRRLPEIVSQLTNLPINLLSKRPSRATIMAQR